MMRFLYAAYAATWLIHGGYLFYLWRRMKRLDTDHDENTE